MFSERMLINSKQVQKRIFSTDPSKENATVRNSATNKVKIYRPKLLVQVNK